MDYRSLAYMIIWQSHSQPISGLRLKDNWGLSAGTGKHCVFGRLGFVFIWSCFVFCLLLLLFYVISAPVLGIDWMSLLP